MNHGTAVSFVVTMLAMRTVEAKINDPHIVAGVIARLHREACDALGMGNAYAETLAFLAASRDVTIHEETESFSPNE